MYVITFLVDLAISPHTRRHCWDKRLLADISKRESATSGPHDWSGFGRPLETSTAWASTRPGRSWHSSETRDRRSARSEPRGPVGNSINPHTQKQKAVLRAIIPRTTEVYSIQESEDGYTRVLRFDSNTPRSKCGVAWSGGTSPFRVPPREI